MLPTLPEHRPVADQFVIHYALRNPPRNRGFAVDGVHNPLVVDEYIESLRASREFLCDPDRGGWPDLPKRLPVYIHSIPGGCYGLAMPAIFGNPAYISLASEMLESRFPASSERRQATASHELTHLCQFGFGVDNRWLWLDEAGATATEALVWPANCDHRRYLLNWFTRPEYSIESDSGYGSCLFVRYLHAMLQRPFLPDVYRVGFAHKPVLEAIDALTAVVASSGISLAAITGQDVFGSQYCPDAYLMGDGGAKSVFDHELQLSHGDRAVSESYNTYPVCDAADTDSIDHLGCRYYRFVPPTSNGSRLTVMVSLSMLQAQESLRGELIAIRPDKRRGACMSLARSAAGERMEGWLDDFGSNQMDHAVLVLSNCSYGSRACDKVTFSLSANVS